MDLESEGDEENGETNYEINEDWTENVVIKDAAAWGCLQSKNHIVFTK